MKRKKAAHFSVEDIIRNEFKKPVSRGTIGRDAQGLLWAYGVILKDTLYGVEIIRIDLESHKVERVKDKEKFFEHREDANVYITGLKKEILPADSPAAATEEG